MNPTILFSIIITTYYTSDVLLEVIDSVLKNANIELIIVNNGNPANVITKLSALAANNTNFKLITGHGNIGFGRANNLGVATSHGEYVLILNPDCIVQPDTFDRLLKHAARLPPPYMIGPRIINTDGSDQRGCRRDLLTPLSAFVEALHLGSLFPNYRLNQENLPLPQTLSPVPAISGAFMFMRRTDYDRINGFDEAYFLHVEDLDFCLRFRRAGGEIYFAPDVIVTHVGGTSRTTSDFVEKCKACSFSLYFHRNFGTNYPLIFLWCLDIAIWARYVIRRLLRKCGIIPE